MSRNAAVAVFTTTDHSEAEILKNLLVSAGIPAEIVTSRTMHWGEDVVQAVGQVDVVVPSEDEADARALLDAAERGELAIKDDDTALQN
jgi:hypothetical protein